ncbi:MAG: DUF2288 domain-containing protein [Methylomonas sp.]|nr:DUF2288 domain-containing protein [Methylomonas sp.]PPD20383.1 MAG: hypothetical protein CTY23_08895 [Methylomonas sp.]PPD25404.1 MAG: hypothetical protein CTY22_08790 [Methylomonas sp.]PPD35961.1 MAG: hypothetical protein CTY21_08790 [Methylomonas sp.]PPD40534.1 MAG: hypothetical protein CTY17_06010 [Methylomonas sp.]
MKIDTSHCEQSKTRVNLETARIPWRELQRFFAAGLVISVERQLDLVDVACEFSNDNKAVVEQWLQQGRIGHVPDTQAADWFEQDAEVWAVVVKPWILVQDV